MPITVAVATRASWLGVSLTVGTSLLLLAVIAHRVRRGRWSDHDVSDPGQRHSLYPVAIATVGTSTMLAWGVGVAPGVLRGFAVALCLLVGAAVVTRWTKVSLHTMWGAFCVSALVGSDIGIALVFGAFVACVGWSRVVLGRHTLGQVVIGGTMGCLGGGLVVVLNKVA
jgi:membrane-associated phospholipid phosphatase